MHAELYEKFTLLPHVYLYCRPHYDVCESLDGSGEVKLTASLAVSHLDLQSDEPVTTDFIATFNLKLHCDRKFLTTV